MLDTLLADLDYFRGVATIPRDHVASGHHKEWHHFLVHTPDADILINFNLLTENWSGAPHQVARVIVIVRHHGWAGGVDQISGEHLQAVPGSVDVRFGRNTLSFIDGRYVLSIALESAPITAQLEMEVTSEPAVLRNFPLAPGRSFSWVFVPRLSSRGWVDVGGRRISIDGAAGYHDHNWGSFRWADDFAWEWGAALPVDAGSPWSSVMVRATDRGRRSSRCQLLLLYRNDEPVSVFHDEDLTFQPSGRFRACASLRVPPVAGLLAGGNAWDIPETLTIEANRGDDRLIYRFTCRDFSQVVVPNDGTWEGVTALCEVVGDVELSGEVGGEGVLMSGRGVLELVR